MRNPNSPSPSFYRVFQAIGAKQEEVSVKARMSQEVTSLIDISNETNQKFEIKQDSEMKSKVTVLKTEWK